VQNRMQVVAQAIAGRPRRQRDDGNVGALRVLGQRRGGGGEKGGQLVLDLGSDFASFGVLGQVHLGGVGAASLGSRKRIASCSSAGDRLLTMLVGPMQTCTSAWNCSCKSCCTTWSNSSQIFLTDLLVHQVDGVLQIDAALRQQVPFPTRRRGRTGRLPKLLLSAIDQPAQFGEPGPAEADFAPPDRRAGRAG